MNLPLYRFLDQDEIHVSCCTEIRLEVFELSLKSAFSSEILVPRIWYPLERCLLFLFLSVWWDFLWNKADCMSDWLQDGWATNVPMWRCCCSFNFSWYQLQNSLWTSRVSSEYPKLWWGYRRQRTQIWNPFPSHPQWRIPSLARQTGWQNLLLN